VIDSVQVIFSRLIGKAKERKENKCADYYKPSAEFNRSLYLAMVVLNNFWELVNGREALVGIGPSSPW